MKSKSDLVGHVAEAAGITKAEADRAVDAVLDGIGTLTQESENEKLSLRGFGTFSMTHRKASEGRNPRTGEPIQIPASSRITFKQSKKR